MEAKKYLYAAVGAPVTAGRAVQGKLVTLREKLADTSASVSKETRGRMDEWAEEGEKAIDRISEGKVVDELTAKVDFDQVQEQVSKLRDQLEDMLDTWRANFRPAEKVEPMAGGTAKAEKPAAATAKPATTASPKPAAKKPSAKKPAAKKPAAKKPAAKAS